MTEASHQIASNPLPPFKRKAGSVGISTGTEVAIMDETGNLVSPGEIGEIVLRGTNITLGYEGNSQANQKQFTNGWFRTGDQGYLDNDGYFFLTGRIKELINYGGTKISPLEIEAVLLDHPAIAEAVVFPISHPTLGEDVAAAVVLKSAAAITEGQLQKFAALRLSDFKIPRRIEFVDQIPKSPTGKVQRSDLASKLGVETTSRRKMERSEELVEPRKDLESKVANIWSAALRLERISIYDDFFYLGGDSLAAAEVILEFSKMFDIEVSFLNFFESRTVADMASTVASLQHAKINSGSAPPAGKQQSNNSTFDSLIELQRGKSRTPIFFFPGGGGGEREFFDLVMFARHMHPEYRFYGFRARGLDGLKDPHSCMDEMVEDYIAEMQKLQPEGPYFLLGDCIGGVVAYEVARQLAGKGQRIARLILVDGHRPTKLRYYTYRFSNLKEDVLSGLAHYWKRILRNGKSLRCKLETIWGGTIPDTRPLSKSTSYSPGWMRQLQNPINPQERIYKVGEVYRRNIHRYSPKPYKGEIKLIVNEEWFRRNATLGWLTMVVAVDSYVVPGDHSALGQHAESVGQQLMKWLDEARGEDRNVGYCDGTDEPVGSKDFPFFWTERLETAKRDLAGLLPNGSSFILIDHSVWGSGEFLRHRSAIPFFERDGVYWGRPADDDSAIREFERLRRNGAKFIVFAWPSFWWFDYYAEFARHLYSNCRCVLQNERLVVFDLH